MGALSKYLVSITAFILLTPGYVLGQIYASQSRDDEAATSTATVVLSNFQSNDAPSLLIDAPVVILLASPADNEKSSPADKQSLPFSPAKSVTIPNDLMPVINSIAAEQGLSPNLLKAVIATESGFNIRALSPKGAMGLMQLMPATAMRFGATDAFVPAQNIRAGAAYLKWLLALFRNDLELALAAYNAGENAVLKAGNRIPAYAETKQYVPKVLSYLKHYNKLS
jgi:soluble lytic murein transglycosylase-like protein